MKTLFILILAVLFSPKQGYSQKAYKFDYVLEYEYEHPANDGKVHAHTHYRFINSSDNSYILLINVDEKVVSMRLITEGGQFYHSTISEEDFLVEAISLRCPATGHVTETKLNNYAVVPKNDTIINSRSLSRVELLPVNEKKFKKGELSAREIIMDNTLGLKFPFFTPDDTAHRFYNEGEKIPNGLLKESVVTDFEGNITGRTRLIQYIPLKKMIMVDKNCK